MSTSDGRQAPASGPGTHPKQQAVAEDLVKADAVGLLWGRTGARAIDDAKAGSQTLVDQLGSSTDVERDLRDFARQHVALVTQPHLIQMAVG